MAIDVTSPSVIEFRYTDPISKTGITKLKIEKHTIDNNGYMYIGESIYEPSGIQLVGNTSFSRVYNQDEITTNTYYIDNNIHGSKVIFDLSHVGETHEISYYSCGCDLLSASRVFTFLGDSKTPDTLQTIIDNGEKFIELQKTYNSADDLINTLIETKNTCIQELDDETSKCKSDLETKTTDCEGRVDKKITDANKVLDDCTRVNDNMKENLSDMEKYRSGIVKDAEDNATALINSGLGGYVIKRRDELLIVDKLTKDTGTVDENGNKIYDLDEDDKSVKIWRYNKNGLGYSSTGYHGIFTLAMTSDGQIVADFITTGTMSANRIRGGIITALNNNGTKIDFNNGIMEMHNLNKDKIMSVNDDGYLETNYLTVKGSGDNNILFTGEGSKSVVLESRTTSGNEANGGLFIFFKRRDKTDPNNVSNTKIGVYSGDDVDRSSQLFIEPGSQTWGNGMVIYRGSGSTSTQNEPIKMQVVGNIMASNVSSSGADYAEYFEWKDGNTNNEDRIGYLVQLDEGKIIKANGTDILGSISATASIIGDGQDMEWQGKYLKDDFGRVQKDKEGKPILNPLYNPDVPYIPRKDRKEWDIVGMYGKLLIRDNGLCKPNDYISAKNGIAIPVKEKTNMKMMKRISDNVIQVYRGL